ncbi:Na+/H+ antiporter subunit E [Rhodococcoides corynebacterioides]|uniref:Multicomponent Na+:H+ antiporter subunit E n=1 Tax=Rhodococcoides corynebacterioides TaxID=53972 RepID=A0ABS2KWR8_9NOCA|nr:multicomponent Na+:H+ antiporter subunit E [Rhodococcus corynebacterioides]MBP1114615.1 multicomponent Na+:H+ antiporter subunit E [Rhodococcus sp. PvP016]
MTIMGRDIALKAALLAWLTGVWVLLWGNLSPANVLGGIVVGLFVMTVLALPRVPVEGRVHPLSVVRLVVVLVYYAAQSSVQVAWAAIRPGPPPVNAVLRYPVEIKSDLVLTFMVDALNMVPGTMVLDIDREDRVLYIHVLDVGKPDAVDQFRTIVRTYESAFIAAFERDLEWHPASIVAPTDDSDVDSVADTIDDISTDYSRTTGDSRKKDRP